MSRVPIRWRVTLAFTAVMAVVLAGVGVFLYLRLEAQLDESVDSGLRSRASDVAALARGSDGRLSGGSLATESDESFAQILSFGGRVLDSTDQVGSRPTLDPTQLAAAGEGARLVEIPRAAGIEGRARVMVSPIELDGSPALLVVGSSLADRDEALSNLAKLLAIGGPITLLLASLAGYWVTGAALRPVDRMRRQAARISAGSLDERLSVPEAGDELTRLGETLNAMLDRLAEAIERERRFVDDASHELRTPLALQRAELELAVRHARSEDELRAAIASATDETDRLVQLADDLLVVARTDDGRMEIHPRPVAVDDLFGSIATRFAGRAERAGTTVAAAPAPGLVIEADRSRVEQALTNLAENALRHGAGPVQLTATVAGGRVELHVTDHGPGFPPSFLDRAFERFSQAAEGRTVPGRGLGLAIVQSIARAHGGAAQAQNRATGGADVWFTVARAD